MKGGGGKRYRRIKMGNGKEEKEWERKEKKRIAEVKARKEDN